MRVLQEDKKTCLSLFEHESFNHLHSRTAKKEKEVTFLICFKSLKRKATKITSKRRLSSEGDRDENNGEKEARAENEGDPGFTTIFLLALEHLDISSLWIVFWLVPLCQSHTFLVRFVAFLLSVACVSRSASVQDKKLSTCLASKSSFCIRWTSRQASLTKLLLHLQEIFWICSNSALVLHFP